jgi:hypothetical protein
MPTSISTLWRDSSPASSRAKSASDSLSPVTAQRDLDLSAHRRQRRTQVVTRIGDHSSLCLEGTLQSRENVVEYLDQPGKLVHIGVRREAPPSTRVDRLGLFGDFENGPDCRACEPTCTQRCRDRSEHDGPEHQEQHPLGRLMEWMERGGQLNHRLW